MKLVKLRLCNFQSFPSAPVDIELSAVTFLLGPNGSGKTAVLLAMARLFGFERSMRPIRKTDFHAADGKLGTATEAKQRLWIEAHFDFPELKKKTGKYATIPPNFAHMQLLSADGIPRIRVRLSAEMDTDCEIDEQCLWVLETDAAGEPTKTSVVSRSDRNSFHIHYLPARRDPADHVSYAATTLLGRALRSANWTSERDTIAALSENISQELTNNAAISTISAQIKASWSGLHKGKYYAAPEVSFISGELEQLLRHLTIGFSPGETEPTVDFTRLSDGQKSLLYFSLVLAMQSIGRKVLKKETDAFDVDKLRPAIFTLVALEEPENSLSPHYLGRILKCLKVISGDEDAQAIVSTHSPSVVKRVPPEQIRYLRLNEKRATVVNTIQMPAKADEAHKFVREAVQAYPELYFSRLVILGEGDSEEVVIPRILEAGGIGDDESSIAVVPLGGRHVNHFWRLLNALGIPHVTLLDLDLGRHQGGWGRVKYALNQLFLYLPSDGTLTVAYINGITAWDGVPRLLEQGSLWPQLQPWLEGQGVFFSSPLDLDFAMLTAFPDTYKAAPAPARTLPEDSTVKSVLGKSHGQLDQYTEAEQKLFATYHSLFKIGSKPAEHLQAMSELTESDLKASTPSTLNRLIEAVKMKLAGLPE
jgi:putative ATP-dependent endonuclease of OLD family